MSTRRKRKKTGEEYWKFVEVRWLDARSCSKWKERKERVPPALVIHRGWLYNETAAAISLCAGYVLDDDGRVSDVGDTITIPRGCVDTITDLG